MKKGTISLLLVLFVIACLAVSCKNEQLPPHEHTYEEKWQILDDTYHVKKATCEHKDEALKEEHKWNDGVVTKPATTTEAGVRTFTCTECGHKRTEKIPMSPAIQFEEGYSIDKTYDKTGISIDKNKIIRTETNASIDENEIDSILFKAKDAEDNTYTETAPINAGEYTVKVTIKESEGHEKSVLEENFIIKKKELSLKIVPTKPYDGTNNIISVSSDNLEGVISPDNPTLSVLTTSLLANSTYKEYNIIPSSGGNEKNNYIIKEDDNLKNARITPLKLKVNKVPTREYDGTDFIGVDSTEITGFLSGDKPTIKVKMNSQNVEAQYKNAEIVSSEGRYEAINYMVDEDDTNLKKANITKRKISVSKIPTKPYDGETRIKVNANDITGYVLGENPEIEIFMASKDVGSKYSSHRVVGGNGNYEVDHDSIENYLKKANITKKRINLPSYSVPVAGSSKNRNFILGPNQGIRPTSETIVVKYQNEITTWNEGTSFNANSGGRITNPDENKNYNILMPAESKIKILTAVPSRNNLGSYSIPSGVTRNFTVKSTADVFSFKVSNIEERQCYILLKYKDKAGYVPLDNDKLTGVAEDVNILYLNLDGSLGTHLFKCNYKIADFYLHDLEPGEYELKVYKRTSF